MDTVPRAEATTGRGWYVALVFALLLAFRIGATPHGLWVDLDVYIAGGNALLDGTPLYDVRVADLPFTYPPFAGVLFIPLALLPLEVTRLLVSLLFPRSRGALRGSPSRVFSIACGRGRDLRSRG